MKKTIFMSLTTCLLYALALVPAFAATTTNITVRPDSAEISAKNVVGVSSDAATGFPSGSIASNGIAKTDIYFTPLALFGRDVTLGEIDSMSYWTKKGTTHTVSPSDWYMTLYTKKYTGQTTGWYGARIGTEPYFSINLTDPANTWNLWSTNGSSNQLRFFESTFGYFGSYTDPAFATFVSGNSLSGAGPRLSLPYAGQQILFFSVQTGSAWAAGFTGQVDGLTITLKDGSIATVNFEPLLPTYTVTIAKYLDKVHATSALAGGSSYPMVSSWNAVNIGAGSGSYALGPTGFNNPTPYEATTSQMTSGASYSTNEATNSLSGVLPAGTACQVGKTRLVGYTTGDSLVAAASLAPSTTQPSLTNITTNKYVIVWNESCVAPTKEEQCEDGGWKKFNSPSFNSQEKCEDFVEHATEEQENNQDENENLKSFKADESFYYNGPTDQSPLYGSGPISFTWDENTGKVIGGYYTEQVPSNTGTIYHNLVTGGTVIGNTVNLIFDRTNPNVYHFTFTGTLVDGVLRGNMDGAFLFIAKEN